MDAVVELGYQIEEEEKERTILHLIIQRISKMLSNDRLKEKRKVYHGDKLWRGIKREKMINILSAAESAHDGDKIR